MADKKFSMDDYVDVAERIQDFKDRHPDGSLQLLDHGVMTIGSADFVYCTVAAFRDADDPRPGHGIAWEPVPGKTSFTKDSELMNAHTAAIGRAVIALGLVANRKLASRTEVRNRIADHEAEKAAPALAAVPDEKPAAKPAAKPAPKPKAKPVPKLTSDERKALVDLYVAAGWDQQTLALQLVFVDALPSKAIDALGEHPTADQYADVIGPAMGALNPQQYADMISALQLAVDAAKEAA